MEEISKRYKTLDLKKIDTDTLSSHILDQWRKSNQDRDQMLQKREEWTANWRDLNKQRSIGPWENSSDFNSMLTLSFGKAVHARLWQLFSDMGNFFSVKARKEVFEEREESIKQFMQFILMDYCNGKQGTKDIFDEWLWDNVFDGSGYLKLYYQRDTHEFLEVVPQVDVTEKLVFDPQSLTGRTEYDTETKETEVIKEEVVETPYIKRILMEDINLPIGEGDPQTAKWVSHRVFMNSDDMKARALEEKFDYDSVEKALTHRMTFVGDNQVDEVKRVRMELDGYFDSHGYHEDHHAIIEWYGKAYVEKEIDQREFDNDIKKIPQEVVIWVHQASGIVLGWTYLYRVSPGGIRPIFKSDFIHFPNRSHGVGVAEVLAPVHQAMNAIYNLRQDNGVLASTPFGFYRASAGLKPDIMRVQPGTFLPLDDPQNDVKVVNMPFLAGFGYQEEDRLQGYAERLLNVSDLQLGRTPNKVGMFRTASGANAAQSESGIQLEIHFDRIARTLSRLLQALFRLSRERIPSELYYRITGENGQPIFGKVNREDLKGEFDFEINVDILGESRIEAQQKAVMMMQTLINPAFTQTGVVTPDSLYHLARNFLLKNRVRRVDNFISKPQGYQGEVVTPAERVFRIVVGSYMNPPIESTVRMADNHEEALAYYNSFKQSDEFGLMTKPEQLAALNRLEAKHKQMMMAVQAGSNPNMTGMQTPREGFAPMEAGSTDQGTLGAPMGEANGPVV